MFFLDSSYRFLIAFADHLISVTGVDNIQTSITLFGVSRYCEGLYDSKRLLFVIITVLLLELTFWSCVFFYMILIEKLNMLHLQKYAIQRIQPYPSGEILWECFKDVIFGHFVIRPVLLFFVYPYLSTMLDFSVSSIPSFQTLSWQFLVCMQVDDMLFYWIHRLCHVGWFYKHIHKKHHEFKHTVAIAVEWAHPVEEIIANTLPTMLGPILLNSHVVLFWIYVCAKLWQSIDAHSGFNLPFPFSPWSIKYLYMDSAPAHYFHHSVNMGNYGGFFSFWDRICGTDSKYGDINNRTLREKD